MKKLAGLFRKTAVILAAVFVLYGCDNTTAPLPVLPGSVSISGTAKVGETLTAVTGSLGGEGAISYEWQRGDSGNGDFTAVSENGGNPQYTPVDADAGKHIRLAVSREGYSGTVTSAPVGPVEEANSSAITYTATANGKNGEENSTAIEFVFNEAVIGLTSVDITVTNGSGENAGSVTAGTLTGSGKNWTLEITVITAGNVTVAINKTGIGSETKTVAVHRKPQLTDDVEFGYTGNNISDIGLNAQTPEGIGTANQSYYFSVTEKSSASFTVTKTAAQSVSVGGTDADKVTKQSGTFEGSTVSDTLEVFTVAIDDMTKYFGGERNFSLTVAESGELSKTININLAANPDIANPHSTVLSVVYDMDGNPTLTIAHIEDTLTDALKWIDVQTDSGASDTAWKEYLVRLEQDEAIKKISLTCWNADYVKVRLRGVAAERKISHDGSTDRYNNANANALSSDGIGNGLLNVGWALNVGFGLTAKHVALQIEDKVTLDGKNEVFNTNSSLGLQSMVNVWQGCRFVMEEGSRITGHKAGADNYSLGNLIILAQDSAFFMKGGEISGNTRYDADGAMISFVPTAGPYELVFNKTGGVFRDNTFNGASKNYIMWDYYWTISVPENDSATQISFTTWEEFDVLKDQ
jgi:hypothetical protein